MTARATPHRILVSRTDGLGDSLLTLPLCGLLRERYPDSELIYLARGYTRPFVERSRHITAVLDWDAIARTTRGARATAVREAHCDAVVHVFPRQAVAAAAHGARIPWRIGTSRRWFHWLHCNELVPVSRRTSALHESQLNVLIAGSLLGVRVPPSLDDLGTRFGLVPPSPTAVVRTKLDPQRFNLMLHPLSLGSGARWPLERFAELIALLSAETHNIIISGSGAERPTLSPWMNGLPRPVTEAIGLDATDFMALVAGVDGCVAASTGPLHLAAALGIHTLGLYPNASSSAAVGRWRPIGVRAAVITPSEPCADCARFGSACPCIARLTAAEVAAAVSRWPYGARPAN